MIAITSAETYRELQERTAALAERNSEYGERIEQQAATIDVLKVMSASPGDAQPVFELIVERARAFCEADGVAVALLDGDRLHLRTHRGYADSSPWAFEARFPLVVNTTTIFGRTILMREAVQVPDCTGRPRPCRERKARRRHALGRWGADAPRRHADRRHRFRPTRAGRLYRDAGGTAADLRRTGGDRHQAAPRLIASYRNAPRRWPRATANTANGSNSRPRQSMC